MRWFMLQAENIPGWAIYGWIAIFLIGYLFF